MVCYMGVCFDACAVMLSTMYTVGNHHLFKQNGISQQVTSYPILSYPTLSYPILSYCTASHHITSLHFIAVCFSSPETPVLLWNI